MWVAREGVDTRELEQALEASRDSGIANIHAIAAAEAAQHGLTTEALERYFTENLHFYLGTKENRGLAAFQQSASECGLLSQSAKPTSA